MGIWGWMERDKGSSWEELHGRVFIWLLRSVSEACLTSGTKIGGTKERSVCMCTPLRQARTHTRHEHAHTTCSRSIFVRHIPSITSRTTVPVFTSHLKYPGHTCLWAHLLAPRRVIICKFCHVRTPKPPCQWVRVYTQATPPAPRSLGI